MNQDRLASIIHRGRDHGLPTYVKVRTSCGFSDAKQFHDLNNTISDYNINMLKQIYKVRITRKRRRKVSLMIPSARHTDIPANRYHDFHLILCFVLRDYEK